MGWDQAETGMEGDSGQLFGAVRAQSWLSAKPGDDLGPEFASIAWPPVGIRTAWEPAHRPAGRSGFKRKRPSSLGTPEDVAAVTRWLVSPAAQFITGQVIRVMAAPPCASEDIGENRELRPLAIGCWTRPINAFVRLAEKEFRTNGHQTAGRRGSIQTASMLAKEDKKNTKWIARFLKVLRQPAAKILDFFFALLIIFSDYLIFCAFWSRSSPGVSNHRRVRRS